MVLSKSIQTKQERLEAAWQSLPDRRRPQDCAVLWPVEGASGTDLGCRLRPAAPKSHTQEPGRTRNFLKRRASIAPSVPPRHPALEGGTSTAAVKPHQVFKARYCDGFSSPPFLQALSRCRVRGCRWRCWGLSLDSFPHLPSGADV